MKRKEVTLTSIPDIFAAVEECIAKAEKNNKSLNGDNYYSNRFYALRAQSLNMSSDLREEISASANSGAHEDATEFFNDLESVFRPEVPNAQKKLFLKDLRFRYKALIKPIIPRKRIHEPSGNLFPLELVDGTRSYIKKIAVEANGCYENDWCNSAAVMVRRLLEILIIECYEAKGIASKIKENDGYKSFEKLVDAILSESSFHFEIQAKHSMKKMKKAKIIGDLGAHGRQVLIKKADLNDLKQDIRIIVESLITVWGVKA